MTFTPICKLTAIALAASCGLASAGVVSSSVLDDFDTDPNTGLAGPRTININMIDNPFNQPASFGVDTAFDIGTDQGALVFNSGIGVKQGASIVYNNSDAGLGFNGNAMGLAGFCIDFLEVDQNFILRFELGDGAGGLASYEAVVFAGINQTIEVSFGDFQASPGFDMNDIDSIALGFNNGDNSTASLDFIASEFRMSVVPTPGALALLGLGGLAASRRRR